MKFLLSTLVLLASCLAIFAENKNSKVFESQIEDALECFRGLLINGVPEYDFPSFNPLVVPEGSVDLSELGIEGLSGRVAVEDLYIAGLTDFQYSNIKGTIGLIPPRYIFQGTINFPLTTISTKYDLDVQYADPVDVRVYGAGDFGLEAVNFSIDIDATVTVLGGINISNLDVWVSLAGLNSFTLTGYFNDEELSAQIVETVLADPSGLVADYAQTVNDLVTELVTDLVNNGGGSDDGFLSDILSQCI
ncbi:hemolymph juvenile hormone binding protein (JHBP) [Popillia japonica]|uniref:Hemolymph juvenile hormone binding protein (JHBP) n=1 Tax=Popillia japonica TaxID=7064 RepID=A0AAW1LTP9_POPJA